MNESFEDLPQDQKDLLLGLRLDAAVDYDHELKVTLRYGDRVIDSAWIMASEINEVLAYGDYNRSESE